MLRCKDNSIYCGYTTDINRRIAEHKNGIGSKYVKAKGFKSLELYIKLSTKKDAMKMEFAIKKLTKSKKEKIINGDFCELNKFNIEYENIIMVNNNSNL
ncbi:GIY-YIG nuclease family protein [Peptostreptococcus faecalis]|uniref:GIY-YIG nuclease family protein n=1 Tax=Peptostreptococcus faecalis TaxID=2045015 RepID=UPI001FA8B8B7|nr:GIY-YIG nuclease family protein [Peptostreptococcus faecalis]